MSFNYSGDPSVSDVAAVRFEIQDTDASAPLLQDEEIAYAILQESGSAPDQTGVSLQPGPLFSAAARCCEVLARLFSAQADEQVGSLKTTYTKQAAQYTQTAKDLRRRASSMGAPYAGGQSISEKEGFAQDTDIVQPAFQRDMFSSPWTGEDQGFNVADLGPPFPQ